MIYQGGLDAVITRLRSIMKDNEKKMAETANELSEAGRDILAETLQ